MNRLGKSKRRSEREGDWAPVFHCARMIPALEMTRFSELGLKPHPWSVVQKHRYQHWSTLFDDILLEYGVKVETRYIGAEEVDRRIDERLAAMNGEAQRRVDQEIKERADLAETLERIRRHYPRPKRPRDLFLNVGSW